VTPVEGRDPHEAGAMGLARVARLLDERIDDPRRAAGRERLLLALARRRRTTNRSVMLFAAALGLAVAVAFVVQHKPAPLEFRVAGTVVTDGDWMDVPPSGGPVSLSFSDGTELDLGPGTKGRVADVTSDGARVVLGVGVLQARVVHRPRTRWAVAAGPYTVEVTGTAFDVSWSAAGAQLELSLHDGSVIVRGPSLPDGIRVAAGQRLVARATTGEAQLSSLLTAQLHQDAPVASDPGPAVEEPTPAHPAPRPLPTWSEMLADGNFRGVLDAAETRGVDATLGRGSLADVVAFADAARYVHERGLAKRGLLAERSRFARSAEARAAAFVLGSMADDGGARGEAIRWYDTYLAESPRGSFAAEALGRKLVALVESGDAAGVHSVAAEYLRRFPHGAHAAYARDHVPEP
jgi:hypothetical protein